MTKAKNEQRRKALERFTWHTGDVKVIKKGKAKPQKKEARGADWFANQDEATQRAVLGSNVAYELWKSGKAELSDFVGYTDDGSVYQRSVKQITGKR